LPRKSPRATGKSPFYVAFKSCQIAHSNAGKVHAVLLKPALERT